MESCNRMASERSSRLRPLAIDHVAALASLVLFAVSYPTVSQEDDAAPRVAVLDSTVLDRFLDEVHTLEARFEQELFTADGRLAERQSGTLVLERPSRFRWHYSEPFEQLVVADGKNVWIHDVELEQVTVTPLDESAASSPAMLLSGDQAVREGFTVVDEIADGELKSVLLEPELEGTDFRSVRIGFDGLTPRRLELVDGLGQVTVIELFDVKLNGEIDEKLFRFDPPRGVDVIGKPAR